VASSGVATPLRLPGILPKDHRIGPPAAKFIDIYPFSSTFIHFHRRLFIDDGHRAVAGENEAVAAQGCRVFRQISLGERSDLVTTKVCIFIPDNIDNYPFSSSFIVFHHLFFHVFRRLSSSMMDKKRMPPGAWQQHPAVTFLLEYRLAGEPVTLVDFVAQHFALKVGRGSEQEGGILRPFHLADTRAVLLLVAVAGSANAVLPQCVQHPHPRAGMDQILFPFIVNPSHYKVSLPRHDTTRPEAPQYWGGSERAAGPG
jgi:hypothetical protein